MSELEKNQEVLDEYFEVRCELRKITRNSKGEFIKAEDVGIGEPILCESDNLGQLRKIIDLFKQTCKVLSD